jgi:hypothetical protein
MAVSHTHHLNIASTPVQSVSHVADNILDTRWHFWINQRNMLVVEEVQMVEASLYEVDFVIYDWWISQGSPFMVDFLTGLMVVSQLPFPNYSRLML